MNQITLHAFLTRHRFGVLSSISLVGNPQSALVGIAVTPDLEIIFDTLASTRKHANLIAHPACSFVIGTETGQTLQYEGLASIPTGPALKRYQQIYFAAWPDGIARMSWPGLTHFVVRPRWIRYSDFDQSPPLIEETYFGAS